MDLIALENLDEKHEQTSDQKLRKRKYWFIYPKKSEADKRQIDYQDNTPTHIILTIDDLITEKAKNQKNLDVVLSGFFGNKDNSGHVNVRGKKVEELLKLGHKVNDNELKGTACSSTGNFGFGINKHIDLGPKYDSNTYIYGMDFFTFLARKGKKVSRRKHQRSRF